MTTSTAASSATIRPATAGDLPAIYELLEASSLPTVGVDDALEGFFVAESNRDVVGVIGLEACGSRFALLRSAAVAGSWQKHGLGRRLVERALAEASARNYEALYLLTTTAEHYFPKFGFATIERADAPVRVQATEEFRGACPASAIAMALAISPSQP
jgi:amino-acid N-acetyltransferase